jgi:hypothetical protein
MRILFIRSRAEQRKDQKLRNRILPVSISIVNFIMGSSVIVESNWMWPGQSNHQEQE